VKSPIHKKRLGGEKYVGVFPGGGCPTAVQADQSSRVEVESNSSAGTPSTSTERKGVGLRGGKLLEKGKNLVVKSQTLFMERILKESRLS